MLAKSGNENVVGVNDDGDDDDDYYILHGKN